jgi:3-keto-5-aminohexanoate cleavage enzyme
MSEVAQSAGLGKPFIIMSAPNGSRRGKRDHPALPITPRELADCADVLVDAGASVIHLHVRDENGRHTLDADRYRAAIAAIHERTGEQLVIQVTTEACGLYSPLQQMAVVRDLRPEAVSMALRELCPDAQSERSAASFFHWLKSTGMMAQYILYSPSEVARFEDLRSRGVFAEDRPFVLFVIGRYGTERNGEPGVLEAYRAALGDQAIPWAVCCFGNTEDAAIGIAAQTGGHGRVGFENNLHRPDGALARDNADPVRLAAAHAGDAGRPLASANDVRSMLA